MSIEQFLQQRFEALLQQDFAAVYRSYHPDSPFLQQFSSCDDYLRFARQFLCAIELLDWRCLDQRTLADDQQECLLLMELAADGQRQFFYENALLIKTAAGWRYHSAQKLAAEDYSGAPENISFAHFDAVPEPLRY